MTRSFFLLCELCLELVRRVQRRPGQQREDDEQQHPGEVQRREGEQALEHHGAEDKGDADRRDQQLAQKGEGLAEQS